MSGSITSRGVVVVVLEIAVGDSRLLTIVFEVMGNERINISI